MNFVDYFQKAAEKKASDLHLVAGSVPLLRINKELLKVNEEKLESKFIEEGAKTILDQGEWETLVRERDLDVAKEIFGWRFRINFHYQRDQLALSARLIKKDAPTPEESGFDRTMMELAHLRDGLVLITGPSGSGKSTTLATIIGLINKTRNEHIVTLENPIEYYFDDNQSIIEQREIGRDTVSFSSGLKYVLRQDPNIIMIGEMRDKETVEAALMAAETGHLVLSTLHTINATDSVARIVDFFTGHHSGQVLSQLALVLRAVVSQQLLPAVNGQLVAAREILISNQAVTSLIRRNQIAQLNTVIQTSYKDGMISMNKAIDQLLQKGLINFATSEKYKRNMETQASYN